MRFPRFRIRTMMPVKSGKPAREHPGLAHGDFRGRFHGTTMSLVKSWVTPSSPVVASISGRRKRKTPLIGLGGRGAGKGAGSREKGTERINATLPCPARLIPLRPLFRVCGLVGARTIMPSGPLSSRINRAMFNRDLRKVSGAGDVHRDRAWLPPTHPAGPHQACLASCRQTRQWPGSSGPVPPV